MLLRFFLIILATGLHSCSNLESSMIYQDDSNFKYDQLNGNKIICLIEFPSIAGSVRKNKNKIIFQPIAESFSPVLKKLEQRPTKKTLKKIEEINKFITSRNNYCNSIVNTPNPKSAPPVITPLAPSYENLFPDIGFNLVV